VPKIAQLKAVCRDRIWSHSLSLCDIGQTDSADQKSKEIRIPRKHLYR
jgi:hypothetical protein